MRRRACQIYGHHWVNSFASMTLECARCGQTVLTPNFNKITYSNSTSIVTEIMPEAVAVVKAVLTPPEEMLLCIWCGQECSDADDLDAHEEACSS